MFRNIGIPEDIVSDRRPEFIFKVWPPFFKLLGVTGNLSSGYHPQTNGLAEHKIQEIRCHSYRCTLISTWTKGVAIYQGHLPPPALLKLSPCYIGPFTIHTILDSQRRGPQLKYLVDWEDKCRLRRRGYCQDCISFTVFLIHSTHLLSLP